MNKTHYVSRIHVDDESSFRVLFERYQKKLNCYAAWYLSAAQGPEDVVQEAFVKLWQRWTGFQQSSVALAFLYATVRNHCINIRKHQQVVHRYSKYLSHSPERDGANVLTKEEPDDWSLEKVYDALTRLPPGCRKIISLSYLQGMKNREIAQKLSISINTVKTQKQRGLQVLRQALI